MGPYAHRRTARIQSVGVRKLCAFSPQTHCLTPSALLSSGSMRPSSAIRCPLRLPSSALLFLCSSRPVSLEVLRVPTSVPTSLFPTAHSRQASLFSYNYCTETPSIFFQDNSVAYTLFMSSSKIDPTIPESEKTLKSPPCPACCGSGPQRAPDWEEVRLHRAA